MDGRHLMTSCHMGLICDVMRSCDHYFQTFEKQQSESDMRSRFLDLIYHIRLLCMITEIPNILRREEYFSIKVVFSDREGRGGLDGGRDLTCIRLVEPA